jgi:hypothetical protein
MSQPIGTAGSVQVNASFLQCMAGAAFIGIIFKSPLPFYTTNGIYHVVTAQIPGIKAIIRDYAVIVIAGGIALGVNQLINTLCPALSASTLPVLEGSIKVAGFVAAVFTLKAHLSPFIDTAFDSESVSLKQKAAQYLCPLTISLFTAHYFNFQIKIAESAALTGGIFVLMKILDSGLQRMLGDKLGGAPKNSFREIPSVAPKSSFRGMPSGAPTNSLNELMQTLSMIVNKPTGDESDEKLD